MEEYLNDFEKENFDLICEILANEYKDCPNIKEKCLTEMAQELNKHVFLENGALSYILIIVYNHEEIMRSYGAVIKIGRQCSIYTRIINILDIDENNAKRLYESFIGYCDCQVFSYLMNEYVEYLSAEQREEVLSIAKETFIKEVWEEYV